VINLHEGSGFNFHPGGNWRNVGSPRGNRALECKSPIHPGSVSNIFDIDLETPVWSKVGGHSIQELIPKFSTIGISFELFAENYAENRIFSSIDCAEIEHDKHHMF